MTPEIFKKSMGSLITLQQLDISEGYLDDLYELLKEDFTDKEFEFACNLILKKETLYGKQPPPVLFYKYRDEVRPNAETKMLKEKQDFILKVTNYLVSGYISTDEKNEF